MDIQSTSLALQFSTRYQTGTPTVTDATCSGIQNTSQYNCTAESTVIALVETILLVNVTVSGPYGSNSSVMKVEQSTC